MKIYIFQVNNYRDLMKLESPYIIKVFEMFELDRKPVFVHELLDIDLANYQVKYGNIGVDNVCRLFQQMGQALCVLEVSFYVYLSIYTFFISINIFKKHKSGYSQKY